MAAGGSKKVVLMALGANAGIGVTKLAAYFFTHSGAMLAEAIHSFADSGNQALLLLGGSRAAKEPDERHPLGYGREAYFWAMLVAVILFTLGGGFSIYEGTHKLQHPEPLSNPLVAVVVLLIGCLLEGGSLLAAWRVCNTVRRGRTLLGWGSETGDVDLLVVVFEDLAAMFGLVVALAAVVATWVTGNPMWDAIGTIVVGTMLLGVAVFVGWQVRRLIVGFAAESIVQARIREAWEERGFKVLRLIAVWAGPHRITVACKVRPENIDGESRVLIHRINEAEAAIRDEVPEIAFQFVEPDVRD